MDTNVLNYRVIIEKDSYSDGRPCYMASCPTLGVVDSGDTIDQAIFNIREAIELNIKNLVEEKSTVPTDKVETMVAHVSIKNTFGNNLRFAWYMVHLPAVSPKDLVKILLKHGFIERMGHGSHRIYIHPDGRRTTIAFHSKEIPRGTLRAILKQIQLELKDLK